MLNVGTLPKKFLPCAYLLIISYHTEEERISASVREFQKPPGLEEKGVVTFAPDLHRTFQVSELFV